MYSTYDKHELDKLLEYSKYAYVLLSLVFVDVHGNEDNFNLVLRVKVRM